MEPIKTWQERAKEMQPDSTKWHFRMTRDLRDKEIADLRAALAASREDERIIRDRDTYQEWANKLAEAIAKHFGAEIGEHSNQNCPWAEALEVIEGAGNRLPVADDALWLLIDAYADARAEYTYSTERHLARQQRENEEYAKEELEKVLVSRVPVAQDEREAFEAWASDPVRAEKLPLERWPENDGYKDTRTYTAFYGWKSGREGLRAELTTARQDVSISEIASIYRKATGQVLRERDCDLVEKFARALIDRQASAAVASQGAQPIYQVAIPLEKHPPALRWYDIEKDQYDTSMPHLRRIVYTAPPAAAPAEDRVAQAKQAAMTSYALAAQVNDLAALMRRVIHALNYHDPGNKMASRAPDYLKRNNLQGSPLRAEDVLRDEAAPAPAVAVDAHPLDMVVRDIAELDYTSDTVLDVMQVSEADLRAIIERHFAAQPATAALADDAQCCNHTCNQGRTYPLRKS